MAVEETTAVREVRVVEEVAVVVEVDNSSSSRVPTEVPVTIQTPQRAVVTGITAMATKVTSVWRPSRVPGSPK